MTIVNARIPVAKVQSRHVLWCLAVKILVPIIIAKWGLPVLFYFLWDMRSVYYFSWPNLALRWIHWDFCWPVWAGKSSLSGRAAGNFLVTRIWDMHAHLIVMVGRKMWRSFHNLLFCYSSQVSATYQRQYMDMTPFYKLLLAQNLCALVYNGDVDMVCNFLGGEKFVEALNQPVSTWGKCFFLLGIKKLM